MAARSTPLRSIRPLHRRARRLAVGLGAVGVIALVASVAAPATSPAAAAGPDAAPTFEVVGRYNTGGGAGTAEVAALHGNRMYVLNNTLIDVVDVSDPAAPVRRAQVDLAAYGSAATSVATNGWLVAVAVPGAVRTDPGTVVLLDRDGRVLRTATVGALPDMVTFDRTGLRLLVANEGEPNSYGQPDSVNPRGSVSLVSVARLLLGRGGAVQDIGFEAFDAGGPRAAELPAGVRVFGPGASVSQDLEPEYVTTDPVNPLRAWVTLQEGNAVAELWVGPAPRVVRIHALGLKDHSVAGQGLDPSDKDGRVAIAPWPVKGLYLPDAISSYRSAGRTYLVTANEGDARSAGDFPGFEEEVRVGKLALDPTVFPDAAALKVDAALGRLTLSTTSPRNAAGEVTELHAFGGRSFSIWSADGRQVWDSGDQLEQVTATAAPAYFNSTNDKSAIDDRSDNKGPEPEGVDVARFGALTLAFVGLERIGGFVVYDVTDPKAPQFVQYANDRDFAAVPAGPDAGPEVVHVVPAGESPTRAPLVLVANEVSGTVSLWAAAAS